MRSADWVCRAAVVALAVCAQARPAIVVSNLGINDVDEYAKEFLPDPKTGRTGVERGRFVREYAELLNRFRAQNKDVRIIHPEGGACKVIAAETAKRIER